MRESESHFREPPVRRAHRLTVILRRLQERLRRHIDRLWRVLDWDFRHSLYLSAISRLRAFLLSNTNSDSSQPIVMVDRGNDYKVVAEFHDLDDGIETSKNIEVRLLYGSLTIKGEAQDEAEEKKKDYYLHERYFGSFQQSFAMPDDVNVDKIEATFKKRVLIITLPKKLEDETTEKAIEIKAA